MKENGKIPHIKSVETRHLEERERLFSGLQSSRPTHVSQGVDRRRRRRIGGRVSNHFHSFLPVNVAYAAEGAGAAQGFTFAYISDSHLYVKKTNERFVRQLLRAVDDINKLDPQPDFVFYGGDLGAARAQGGARSGCADLKSIKAPVHMMAGEHDWYFDMGQRWNELFGPPRPTASITRACTSSC
jgi:Icc protein